MHSWKDELPLCLALILGLGIDTANYTSRVQVRMEAKERGDREHGIFLGVSVPSDISCFQ